MFNKRNALAGYLAVMLGRRLTERVVRRRLRRFFARLDPAPARRSRRLPLIGAALAAAVAAAVVVTRQRS